MSSTSGVKPGMLVISADSHMAEPPDLWEKNLPIQYRDRAPSFPNVRLHETNHHLRAGGWDPHERLIDMAYDGISAEVLYPTLGYSVWLVEGDRLKQSCIEVYNDWMIDFCNVSQERFWGLGMMPLHDIDLALKELGRCKDAGLRGGAIYIAPPKNLPYTDTYYEPFWAAAQEMDMPLSMHINARAELRPPDRTGLGWLHSVNGHKFDAMSSLAQIIGAGVLERYPKLQIQVAEVGVGWVPFWLQEFDYYAATRAPLPRDASEYYKRQIASAFISDGVGCYLLDDYAEFNAMWSNDYPHPASIWPDSQRVVEGDVGHLSEEKQAAALHGVAARVYNHGRLPTPVVPPPAELNEKIRSWTEIHDGFGDKSRLNNGPIQHRAGVPVRA